MRWILLYIQNISVEHRIIAISLLIIGFCLPVNAKTNAIEDGLISYWSFEQDRQNSTIFY